MREAAITAHRNWLVAGIYLARRTRGLAALVGLCCAMSGLAWAQSATPSNVKDTIFARKILMDTIDRHMDQLDWMLSSDKGIDLTRGVERADTISVMLLAFPHLFPASTNQWRADAVRDPARDTYASPAIWKNFADFYRRAAAASRIALDASHAKREANFRKHVTALRAACDSCHAIYLKVDR